MYSTKLTPILTTLRTTVTSTTPTKAKVCKIGHKMVTIKTTQVQKYIFCDKKNSLGHSNFHFVTQAIFCMIKHTGTTNALSYLLSVSL